MITTMYKIVEKIALAMLISIIGFVAMGLTIGAYAMLSEHLNVFGLMIFWGIAILPIVLTILMAFRGDDDDD